MSLSKYNAPLLLQYILLRIIKTKIQEISKRGKNLKKNPKLQSLNAPSLLLCRGIYRRYRKQSPSTTLPRNNVTDLIQKVAETRLFAAFPRLQRGQWPRAFLRGLLWSVHLGASFWILHADPILRIRDNLGSKLS